MRLIIIFASDRCPTRDSIVGGLAEGEEWIQIFLGFIFVTLLSLGSS